MGNPGPVSERRKSGDILQLALLHHKDPREARDDSDIKIAITVEGEGNGRVLA